LSEIAGHYCQEIAFAPAAPETVRTGTGVGGGRGYDASVVLFVAGDEIVPGVVDDLPEGRCTRAARVIDRGHACP